MKKANLKFYLDNLVWHEDIRVLIFFLKFFDSAPSFTVADWHCIAQITSNKDLFKFLSYLVRFPRHKLLYLFIFNSVMTYLEKSRFVNFRMF
jgi:hypothetical protein